MSEENSVWGAFGIFRRFNPFVFVLLFALIYVSGLIINLPLPLDQKAIPYILSVALVFLAVFAEYYRMEKERELEERLWR
jgi:hypothetical protein